MAGSTEQTVVRAKARFKFTSAVPEWVLCYQFSGEVYAKYENLPITDTSASRASSPGHAVFTAPEPVSPSLLEKAEVLLTLNLGSSADSESPFDSEAKQASFKQVVAKDMAKSLRIDASRVVVATLTQGAIFTNVPSL
jgi:hypothetical protein